MATAELHKAAVVLMSLPRRHAAGLLARLDRPQVEAVALEIARQLSITPGEQQIVASEFARLHAEAGATGGLELARALVEETSGSPLFSAATANEPRQFEALYAIDSQTLLKLLDGEHPQTIALVASHLPSSCAAELLAGLPLPQQLEVVRRIVLMKPVDPENIRHVERALEQRLAERRGQAAQKPGVSRVH